MRTIRLLFFNISVDVNVKNDVDVKNYVKLFQLLDRKSSKRYKRREIQMQMYFGLGYINLTLKMSFEFLMKRFLL